MSDFVLDCSMTLAWFFEDEATDRTRRVQELLMDSAAFVPSVWPIEVGNALTMARRKGRADGAAASSWLTELQNLSIEVSLNSKEEIFGRIIPLAWRENLTVYDATYLDLAMKRRLPIATLDAELAAAAIRNSIDVL